MFGAKVATPERGEAEFAGAEALVSPPTLRPLAVDKHAERRKHVARRNPSDDRLTPPDTGPASDSGMLPRT